MSEGIWTMTDTELNEELRRAKEQAWDEGRDVAHAEMARMYSSQCEGDDCDCNEPITNPYRSEQ